jgi:hypothetical protein
MARIELILGSHVIGQYGVIPGKYRHLMTIWPLPHQDDGCWRVRQASPQYRDLPLLREKVFGVQDGKIDMNILADAGSLLKELFLILWAKII